MESLEENIFIEPEMFVELQAQGAAMAGFVPGTYATALDLLYGIMLPSGGEATLAIALAVGGSADGFVELMNKKAQDLELENTHFTNPIGLHHENHYTTAADLTKILKYALQNEYFYEMFSAQRHTTDFGAGFTITSTLFRHLTPEQILESGMIGGRTGFTFEAGRCLITLAEINGKTYILVTGGAIDSYDNQLHHIQDALNIFQQLREIH